MKRYALIMISLFCLWPLLACQSDSNKKSNYELQERCGKRAEQVFKIYNKEHYMPLSDYESHYNMHLKKCFTLIKDTSAQGFSEWLIDVNENKRYGTYMTIGASEFCEIKDKPCKTKEGCKQEWDAFEELGTHPIFLDIGVAIL